MYDLLFLVLTNNLLFYVYVVSQSLLSMTMETKKNMLSLALERNGGMESVDCLTNITSGNSH